MERNTAVEYYTPSIEEFCFGFEFIEDMGSLGLMKRKYYISEEPYGFETGASGISDRFPSGVQGGHGHKITSIAKSLKDGLIKVKKLDHDDFFELGFEELAIPEDMEGSNYFKLTESDYVYSIWQEEDRYAITIGENDKWGESIVFYGKIRNKFELSKILNQVKWTSETK